MIFYWSIDPNCKSLLRILKILNIFNKILMKITAKNYQKDIKFYV